MNIFNGLQIIRQVSVLALSMLWAGIFLSVPVSAQIETKAAYALLIDIDSNSTLLEKNADELMAPASMSKLVTLGVLFKAIKDERISLEDEIFISENAWRNGGAPSGTSAMFASLNSEVKVVDLMRGIIVQSGNDASIAIAEGLSGSEDGFVEEMETYAQSIGLTKSSFANPTGLPHPDHLMTARELAIMARHIIETYPEYYPIFSERLFKYKRYKFFNRNPLLSKKVGVDGLKTGFTKASGYGLVASGVIDGRRMILVLNGLKTKKDRSAEAQKLLRWGARNFKSVKFFDRNETVGYARVWGGEQSSVRLGGNNEAVTVLLPRNGVKKIRAAIEYLGPLKAPISKGDQVAYLRVSSENSATNRIPLYAEEDIAEGGVVSKGLGSLFDLTLGWIF